MASSFASFFAKDKTFRPKKKFEPGTMRYSLHKQASASLKSGLDLREIVKLPSNEDEDDWIAVHVVDFFNRINLVYGIVSDFCTQETCPTMSGGPRYEYRWCDGVKYKKPTSLSAPDYMTLLMEWVENIINDESIFPIQVGTPFPKNFRSTCKKLLSRLYRVFVHVYVHHFDRVVDLQAEPHVNMCYKHFCYFCHEFDLLKKEELAPLYEMTNRLCPELFSVGRQH
ncbi:unnamed protein product [Rotaria socialis]|uniref:Uncharacterized protein n=1 Tax=Rotaria socialis TaxID=392032 RepID=A0A820S1T9_9BILA|nr:unnamed protein product [Rotaria socialis]CAF3389687.1 unnamed protein product [Rotaria socialis]CAF3401708.1 unnamed protein product [Rotaria socialis]CAF3473462.1 unnamed protein product [Rotaria socialis]CAF3579057.1 unnamed protein product [Rotaria socialis]